MIVGCVIFHEHELLFIRECMFFYLQSCVIYAIVLLGMTSQKINRVENKALSAERMGCCLFDEGQVVRGFIFAFAACRGCSSS